MSTPDAITVWACQACGYWRQERTTGVHVAANPADPRGTMQRHELEAVTYTLVKLGEAEAQELHECIGAALLAVENGETSVIAELERARELAAVIVADASR